MPKDTDRIDRVAETCGLLASPTRTGILLVLDRVGESSVGSIAEACGLSPSGASQHLGRLKAGGLVKSRRSAQVAYYSFVAGNPVSDFVVRLLRG